MYYCQKEIELKNFFISPSLDGFYISYYIKDCSLLCWIFPIWKVTAVFAFSNIQNQFFCNTWLINLIRINFFRPIVPCNSNIEFCNTARKFCNSNRKKWMKQIKPSDPKFEYKRDQHFFWPSTFKAALVRTLFETGLHGVLWRGPFILEPYQSVLLC